MVGEEVVAEEVWWWGKMWRRHLWNVVVAQEDVDEGVFCLEDSDRLHLEADTVALRVVIEVLGEHSDAGPRLTQPWSGRPRWPP